MQQSISVSSLGPVCSALASERDSGVCACGSYREQRLIHRRLIISFPRRGQTCDATIPQYQILIGPGGNSHRQQWRAYLSLKNIWILLGAYLDTADAF